jgi:hypothetical protein
MPKPQDWSRQEVEAIVGDYLSMLESELSGTPYNKAEHRRRLQQVLSNRSEPSIEFKHANISAALLDAGFPYISGYKPRFNYQDLVAEILSLRLEMQTSLQELAAVDADRSIVVPEVDDILAVLTDPPSGGSPTPTGPRLSSNRVAVVTDYIQREARNRSLGSAGELFTLNYERARLIHAGKENLASRIEHTSQLCGDGAGYDVLSFEESGRERLIEVKTTKYGADTPFFVSKNEVSVSEQESGKYHVYRLFSFREYPRLYTLAGSIEKSCSLTPSTFIATPR